MLLPHITSIICNDLNDSNTNHSTDYSKAQEISLTSKIHAKTKIFLLLNLQSIKNIADPNKYGEKIIDFINKCFNQNTNLNLSLLQKISQKIEENYSKAFYINLSICIFKKHDQNWLLTAFSNFNSQIFLFRQNQLIKLPISPAGISGKVYETDLCIISSSQFVESVSLSEITSCFQNPKVGLNKINVNKFPKDNQISALMISFQEKSQNFLPTQLDKSKSSPFKFQLPSPTIKIQKPQHLPKGFSRRRKIAILLAFAFFIILSIALFLGHKKRQALEQVRVRQQLTEEVQYRLQQSESLKQLNSSRAKTLLQEARTILKQYQEENSNVDIEDLNNQVNAAYAAVSKQYNISTPEIFYDLSLSKEGFSPTQSVLIEGVITMLDENTQTIIQLNIAKKSSEIVAGRDIVPTKAKLAAIPAWVFLASGDKLQIIDPQKKEQLNSFTLSKIQVDQLIGYGNNAYILDKNLGQLWRFRGTVNGLNKPDQFFKQEQDLQNIAFAAIDGSVWFLRKDGGVEKYTTGIKDAYYPSIDLDIPIATPTQFYTDDTSDNLYILDPDNHRVVVTTKQAQYQGQYVWEKITPQTQLAVSEQIGKILLLQDGKIYGIDIRE